ncbi:HAD family phosphatase [Candidatus Acetothermia bacterium]|nr:HAD family phosphatase [Candidatus Acetothermia bacterium]
MNSKLVVGFDMDGVILRSDDLYPDSWLERAFKATLRQFNIPASDENARLLYLTNLKENIDQFCERYGITDPAKLWDKRDENYQREKLRALETGEISLYPDIDALDTLLSRFPMALVSNSPQHVVDLVIAKFSLQRYFRLWIGRGAAWEDLKSAKPAPDMLEQMKERLEVSRGYYIGDQPEDRQAALAAGLVPIMLSRNNISGDITTLAQLPQLLDEREARLSTG